MGVTITRDWRWWFFFFWLNNFFLTFIIMKNLIISSIRLQWLHFIYYHIKILIGSFLFIIILKYWLVFDVGGKYLQNLTKKICRCFEVWRNSFFFFLTFIVDFTMNLMSESHCKCASKKHHYLYSRIPKNYSYNKWFY